MARTESSTPTKVSPGAPTHNGAPRNSVAVRAELEQAEASLQRHVRHLRREMTLVDVTLGGAPLLDHVRRHPFLAAGLAAGGMAAVALLVSLLRRSDDDADDTLRDLVAELRKEFEASGAGDGPAAEAIRRLVGSRGPIVLIAPESKEKGGTPGILGTAVRAAVSSFMGIAAKTVMEAAMSERATESSK